LKKNNEAILLGTRNEESRRPTANET